MSTDDMTIEQCRGPDLAETMAARGAAGNLAAAEQPGEVTRTREAAAESLDQILGSMIHAVSNSLNSIMASSQLANLLITQRRLGEARISLDRAEEECLRAARLLRDGRGLATLKVPSSVEGVDVGALLTACATACADLGEVRVKCEGDLPLVHGQADALKRLFVEILDNAFGFGAHNVTVTAQADHEHRVVQIGFRDDGPGIGNQSTTLFQSFVTSEPAEHSGLGLAFAAQIAAAYGGAVGYGESSDGGVFWVRLAFAKN